MSLTVEKTEIETFFGRCRCCLSYGYLKNMWSEHQYEGESEIYGEMLVQCFALSWNHTEESIEQDQICEQCICRLRDATDFKKIVLDSQQELMHQIDAENSAAVKEEVLDEEFLIEFSPESDQDTADTNYTADTTDYPDTADNGNTQIKDEMEYEEIEYLEEDENGEAVEERVDTDSSLPVDAVMPVKRRKKQFQKEDSDDEAPKRKWPKRLPKSERLKTYKQYTEETLRQCMEAVRNNELTPNEASRKFNIPKKTICAKIKMDPNDAQSINHTAETEDAKNGDGVSNTQKNRKILSKFKENVRSILKFSNATPIRGYWGIGYACIYCNYQDPSPDVLKKHTLSTHAQHDYEVDNVKYVSDMIIKIDITNLECKICMKEIDSLDKIMEHLKNVHKKPIHLDINNHIVPFKFEKEGQECILCAKQFSCFKHLSEHMNEHYPNYECPDCGRHFINNRSLRTHSNRHRTGVFVCAYCSKIFDTRIKMKEHERVLHLKGSKTRKCGYCDEKFMDPVRKKEHEVKVHGAAVTQFECKACGKVFDSQRSLKGHTNHFHLLLRPHKCPECDKEFYNKNELKRHRVKHTKVKEFQCAICSKWYVTRSTLKSHMRTHELDRSVTCDRCGKMFNQKTSLVLHMKRHAESAEDDASEDYEGSVGNADSDGAA